MKFEVIEVFSGNAGQACGIELQKELRKFLENHPNAKISSTSQSSFVVKRTDKMTPFNLPEIPCTILTIFYEE